MMTVDDLDQLGATIILSNAFHLHLRPGEELIDRLGGLHRFVGWHRPILTDSGGFQVFSLSDLRSVSDEGVLFRSPYDGSERFLTPERVVRIQEMLGSDIAMVLDDVVPYPVCYDRAQEAVDRSVRWAERSRKAFRSSDGILGAIAHGSIFPDLRERSIKRLCEADFQLYAIGGLSVGEPQEEMWKMVDLSTDLLPEGRPRYLMGVGSPEDIFRAVLLGVDLFDCVLPTRMGRTGVAYTADGTVNITHANISRDDTPLDKGCACGTCARYSRAYLHHLFRIGEASGPRLLTFHNLHFYLRLMERIREAIIKETIGEQEQVKNIRPYQSEQ